MGTVTTAKVITPTKEVILTFVVEAGHRRNRKGSNSPEPCRIARKCSFFTQS